MEMDRRSAVLLLPLAASISAWGSSLKKLPSTMTKFDGMTAAKEDRAAFRGILEGTTHTGDYLEVHETVLEPGAAPHPPHRHEGEELFLVVSGMLEMTIGGKSETLAAGGAAFVASGDMHGLRNVGSAPAQYFVVTMGKKA